MPCFSCNSCNVEAFPTEMVFHFSGLQDLDQPQIFLFPSVAVCLDCGFSCFATPEKEAALLATGAVHLKPGNGRGRPANRGPAQD
jgi:hypothetical protein